MIKATNNSEVKYHFLAFAQYPGGNYFKVVNRNTRASCKVCSRLTIKTPEQRHWRCSGVFIVSFEHISQLALVLLLLILSKLMPAGYEILTSMKYLDSNLILSVNRPYIPLVQRKKNISASVPEARKIFSNNATEPFDLRYLFN